MEAPNGEEGDAAVAAPVRRDVERNRRRVIQAAREVFAVRGIRAGLSEVAAQAGVGVATVYRHFPDKQALVDAALQERFEELLRVVDQALLAPPTPFGLADVMRQTVAMAVADRGLRDLTMSSRGRGAVHEGRSRLNPLLERLLIAAQQEGEARPDVVVDDLVMIMLMVSDLAYHSEPIRPGAYGRYLDMLLDGLRTPRNQKDTIAPMSPSEASSVADGWLSPSA